MIETIATENAPKALGPYSQALKAGGFIYCSGQIPINPATNAVEATTIEDQTRQAITNLGNVLKAAGSSLAKVVKTTVFISDMNDFAALNGVYAELFGDTKPARSCVQVARLPKDVKLEIEAIAEA
jgi:2-iminobutanoate/2-iminopropanoate deaminase